jgi:membrane-associated protease RseP (regulator of RpoE activity)
LPVHSSGISTPAVFDMQPQENLNANSASDQFCAQCGSPMPKEMRFCRSCGNRLGEGPAEYTPTVRLPQATGATGAGTTPFYPGVNAPLVQQPTNFRKKRRLGFTGMTWLWIVLGLFFLSGGVLSALRKNIPGGPRITINAPPRSKFGVNRFEAADQGVTFSVVEPPDGPADRAGLVGGDIITSFDGQTPKNNSEMTDLLRRTPIGKEVEVIYLRDGISHTTKLKTISEDDFDRLRDIDRPEGMFGFDTGRTERVIDPATKTYGLRLNWVRPNGPADLFGIKEGDIITEFDKVPIRTAQELESRVHRAAPKKVVEVGVVRNGETLKIPVTMGSTN